MRHLEQVAAQLLGEPGEHLQLATPFDVTGEDNPPPLGLQGQHEGTVVVLAADPVRRPEDLEAELPQRHPVAGAEATEGRP